MNLYSKKLSINEFEFLGPSTTTDSVKTFEDKKTAAETKIDLLWSEKDWDFLLKTNQTLQEDVEYWDIQDVILEQQMEEQKA